MPVKGIHFSFETRSIWHSKRKGGTVSVWWKWTSSINIHVQKGHSKQQFLSYLLEYCMLARSWRVLDHFRTNLWYGIRKQQKERGWTVDRRCLTLHKQIKKLDVAKKRKISYREKAEQFEIWELEQPVE